MTLGRTPTGAIKIKSDGGLRAVNCACCNPCGCGFISAPESLRETLENATSAFIWGYNTNEFFPGMPEEDFFWAMNSAFPGGGGSPTDILVEMTYSKNGCLYIRGEYYTAGQFTPDSLALYGDPAPCDLPDGETYGTGTASINGEGGFAYWYSTSYGHVAPPVPNIVFS
jgi:hypothetical protein